MSRKKKNYHGYRVKIEHPKVVMAKRHGEDRFVIIDEDTGEVVDDAQGYGYKTAQNAYRACGYKNRPKEKFDQDAKIERAVYRFCRNHGDIVKEIENEMFYAVKDGVPFTGKDVDDLIPEDLRSEFWFGSKNFLKYMM